MDTHTHTHSHTHVYTRRPHWLLPATVQRHPPPLTSLLLCASLLHSGLARTLITSRVQTRTYGTMTHMPPETLSEGIITKATDVYSVGVLLWQVRLVRVSCFRLVTGSSGRGLLLPSVCVLVQRG